MERKEYNKAIKEIPDLTLLQKTILKDVCYWHYEKTGYIFMKSFVLTKYIRFIKEFYDVDILEKDVLDAYNNLIESNLLIKEVKHSKITNDRFITEIILKPNFMQYGK